MPEAEILNSLLELNKQTSNRLTSSKNPTIKTIAPNETIKTNLPPNPLAKTDRSQLNETFQQQSNWHWQHYHNPYQFGSKPPNFNDYDAANDDDDATTQILSTEPIFDTVQPKPENATFAPNKPIVARKRSAYLAQLSCDSGEMILNLNFSEPFKGIVYPNHDRLSPCRFFGDGHLNYELRLPLRGCGTRQANPRYFVNTVIVRFHKTLELEEDEINTLICRYPPPMAQQQQPHHNRPNFNANLEFENSQPNSYVEFVEPLETNSRNQQMRNNNPDNLNNIETLSENLLVTPSGGPNLSHLQDPYSIATTAANHFNQSRNNQLKLRDPVNLITADQFNLKNSQIQQPTVLDPNNSTSYFDRLSSIELLFLISSLMFLILLAFGLAGSYLCYRRQNSVSARRRRQHMRANEILKASAVAAANNGNRNFLIPSGSGTMQQYYQPSTLISQHNHSHHRNQHLPTSSPDNNSDSNLSRHLLTTSSNANLSRQLADRAPVGRFAMYNNQAFVPELMSDSGKKHQQHQLAGLGGSEFYAASRPFGRQSSARLNEQNLSPRQPVYGRRDSNAYGHFVAQPSQRTGRSTLMKARRLDASKRQSANGLGEYLRPAYSEDHLMLAAGSDTMQSSAGHRARANLLQQQHIYSNQLDAESRPLRLINQTRSPNKLHSIVRKKTENDLGEFEFEPKLHRAKHIYVGPEVEEELGRNSLSRAKSLSSIFHRQTHLNPDLEKQYSRPNKTQNNFDSRVQDQERVESHFDGCSGEEIIVESELKELNNNEREPEMKPKLLLKSIEDSFITNYTEISRQEYMMRDSTKPLGLLEWRKIAEQKRRATNQLNETNSTSSEGDNTNEVRLNSMRSLDEGDLDADDAEDTSYRKSHNNLRSLTEVDVNFTKSLNESNYQNLVEQSRVIDGAESIRSRGVGGGDRNERGKTFEVRQVEINSPDLILSPDYDLGEARPDLDSGEPQQRHRLELVEPAGSKSESHNTVSYV